jgi:hypothetical protein
MLVFSGVLFVTQQHTAKVGQRYRLPVMNNIVLRVLSSPNDIAWFVQQGMPDAALLKEKYSVPADDPKQIYPLYVDPEFARFSAWVAQQGNRVYSRFLLSHPTYLFLLRENRAGIRRMLAFDFGYIGSAEGVSASLEELFPIRPGYVLLVLSLFIYVCIREKSNRWLFPVIILIVFTINAWLLYIADSMEVERHEYITITMVQFLGLMSLSFLLDSRMAEHLLARVRQRIKWQFPTEAENTRR